MGAAPSLVAAAAYKGTLRRQDPATGAVTGRIKTVQKLAERENYFMKISEKTKHK